MSMSQSRFDGRINSRCVLITSVVLVLLSYERGRGKELSSPFVTGFDRFARHGDIEQQIGGRLLLTELNCTACHRANSDSLKPKLGPRLDGVGNRLKSDWLAWFLAFPQVAKPGTTMPDVLARLDDEEKKHAVDALVAFLSAQHAPFFEVKASGANPVPHEFWRKGNPDRGAKLYHQVGCIACHEPVKDYLDGTGNASGLDKLLEQLEPEEIAELGLASAARSVRSVPHGNLSAKYTLQSLTFFLLKPDASRPSGRMPSLKLQPVEAADISAYLLREASSVVRKSSASEVLRLQLQEEGRRLFEELSCASCHTLRGAEPARQAKPLAKLKLDLTKSCFGSAHKGLPHFDLDKTQIESIRAALSESENSQDDANTQVEFQMLQLNCYACHARDERGGVGRKRQAYFETFGQVDLGDEGRIPPPLTRVGIKLTKAWLNKVLAGTGDVRPHMVARMPMFSKAATASLPDMFVNADGPRQPSDTDVFGDQKDLADAGRLLLDIGCVQCHPMRGESLPSVVGIDLAGIVSRVNPSWFRDFLLNPGQFKPRTRMPTFFPSGKSPNPSLLDGDVDRQIAAIWAYLKDIERYPLPEKIAAARSQSFELYPKDRPILLRTFMEQAGTHAIAVGFPKKVHFAFDAERVRFSQAWRGRFLDAHGTWFDRFTPPAIPLGDDSIAMPPGTPVASLKDDRQRWPKDSDYQFLGYRMDPRGVPTFLYQFEDYKVEDQIEPNRNVGLTRRLRIEGGNSNNEKAGLWFRVNVGEKVRREKALSYSNDQGLITTVLEDVEHLGIVRKVDKQTEWIIPVKPDGEKTITVEYQWKRNDKK